MFASRAVALFVAGLLVAGAASAQPVPADTASSYGTGVGLAIQITNNGFGLGGYYSRALDEGTSFWVELGLGAGKDEREQKFFDGFVPGKRNYLLMLPVEMGAQRRLFRAHIEDNFRPYVQFSGGPVLGWEYPYFEDSDFDGRFDDGERRYDVFSALPKGNLHFGLGGTVAVGAFFGWSRRTTQGVRFGYTATYFFDPVDLREANIPNASQQFFGTPVISLTFGRLL